MVLLLRNLKVLRTISSNVRTLASAYHFHAVARDRSFFLRLRARLLAALNDLIIIAEPLIRSSFARYFLDSNAVIT